MDVPFEKVWSTVFERIVCDLWNDGWRRILLLQSFWSFFMFFLFSFLPEKSSAELHEGSYRSFYEICCGMFRNWAKKRSIHYRLSIFADSRDVFYPTVFGGWYDCCGNFFDADNAGCSFLKGLFSFWFAIPGNTSISIVTLPSGVSVAGSCWSVSTWKWCGAVYEFISYIAHFLFVYHSLSSMLGFLLFASECMSDIGGWNWEILRCRAKLNLSVKDHDMLKEAICKRLRSVW